MSNRLEGLMLESWNCAYPDSGIVFFWHAQLCVDEKLGLEFLGLESNDFKFLVYFPQFRYLLLVDPTLRVLMLDINRKDG
jgi:hypothetical protein